MLVAGCQSGRWKIEVHVKQVYDRQHVGVGEYQWLFDGADMGCLGGWIWLFKMIESVLKSIIYHQFTASKNSLPLSFPLFSL